MSLRDLRAVAGRAFALAVAGLIAAVLGLTVIMPKVGGGTAYTIMTGSMEPGMPPGTVVVVRPTSAQDIRTGDVMTYQLHSGEPTVVTHRVVGTTITAGGEQAFLTRGDANDAPDETPVRAVQIRGTAWYSVPYAGLPAIWVGGDIRQVVVMAAVALLLGYAGTMLLGDLRDRRRGRRTATSDGAREPVGVDA